jgi:ketosteroid isomerase-like protein
MPVGGDGNRELVERFWKALEDRDLEEAARCFHDDFVEEWPQSGERIRGIENWLGMATTHPTFPSVSHVRTVGEGEVWASHARYDYGDGTPWQVIAIQEFRDGRIARITEVFGTPFEAAEWRTHLVERI